MKTFNWDFFFYCCGYHRDLHVKRHSFPTRRSSDLLQAARYKFARRGIHHCDFLKPCVKITSYNQHSRSAPFLRALVEETATKSTRPEGADDVIQSIKLVVRLLTEISKSHNSFLWRQLTAS